MLDLGFVRDNLPLIEEKLRQRGMDPTEVLKDFRALDAERRRLITVAETLKAKRNRASEEIARLKKEKQDAGAGVLMAETKGLRTQGEEAEKQAAQKEKELRDIMSRVPNNPHPTVPLSKCPEENVAVRSCATPTN